MGNKINAFTATSDFETENNNMFLMDLNRTFTHLFASKYIKLDLHQFKEDKILVITLV